MKLVFDGDNAEHHSIWNLLLTAWHYTQDGKPLVPIGTTAERLESAIEINRALREGSREVGDGRLDMVEDGVELELRDSTFNLLRESWVAYRAMVPPRLAELAKAVDDFLADA